VLAGPAADYNRSDRALAARRILSWIEPLSSIDGFGVKAVRLPRVRFSVMSLMIAVAVVGSVLGSIMERRARFLRLAEHHNAQVVGVTHAWAMRSNGVSWVCSEVWTDAKGNSSSVLQAAKDVWHRELASKYLIAASRPWAPVNEDPPKTWPEP
jgi:hypothetical protein